MKAVLKLNKNSAYAKYNGKTFTVAEILPGIISVVINGILTDFHYTEVIIIDVDAEILQLKTKTCYTAPAEQNRIIQLNNLVNYCRASNIIL